jgi:hypothetical protein
VFSEATIQSGTYPMRMNGSSSGWSTAKATMIPTAVTDELAMPSSPFTVWSDRYCPCARAR